MLYGNGYDPDKAAENCVVHLDTKSGPRVLWCGEDINEYKLPIGTRVIYAKPPIPGLRDRKAAIRRAVDNPENMDPLSSLLQPGMKLTIAIDDISLPLPMMMLPDIRQTVLEIVLALAASKGVARGRAKVVRTLSEASKLQKGDIMVCELTMPPWTPLFSTVSALVADTGGVLSHCAIVSREYGLPAVVGTRMGTAVIKDGMHLTVDGSKGIVRIDARG